MSKVITVINQKGGVGKSTTAHTLGVGLKNKGYDVLLIDLDAQSNLSYITDLENAQKSVIDILMGNEDINDCIYKGESCDIIPSNTRLSSADIFLSETGKEYKIKEAISNLREKYDFVVIDTPPALGILTINALTASNYCIIPAGADILSLQGIGQLYSTIDAVKKYTNRDLKIMGILITRYNSRTILSRDLTDMLVDTAESLKTKVFDAKIREAVAVKESQISKTDIFSYDNNSKVARDYQDFVDEVVESLEV